MCRQERHDRPDREERHRVPRPGEVQGLRRGQPGPRPGRVREVPQGVHQHHEEDPPGEPRHHPS